MLFLKNWYDVYIIDLMFLYLFFEKKLLNFKVGFVLCKKEKI